MANRTQPALSDNPQACVERLVRVSPPARFNGIPQSDDSAPQQCSRHSSFDTTMAQFWLSQWCRQECVTPPKQYQTIASAPIVKRLRAAGYPNLCVRLILMALEYAEDPRDLYDAMSRLELVKREEWIGMKKAYKKCQEEETRQKQHSPERPPLTPSPTEASTDPSPYSEQGQYPWPVFPRSRPTEQAGPSQIPPWNPPATTEQAGPTHAQPPGQEQQLPRNCPRPPSTTGEPGTNCARRSGKEKRAYTPSFTTDEAGPSHTLNYRQEQRCPSLSKVEGAGPSHARSFPTQLQHCLASRNRVGPPPTTGEPGSNYTRSLGKAKRAYTPFFTTEETDPSHTSNYRQDQQCSSLPKVEGASPSQARYFPTQPQHSPRAPLLDQATVNHNSYAVALSHRFFLPEIDPSAYNEARTGIITNETAVNQLVIEAELEKKRAQGGRGKNGKWNEKRRM